MHNEILKICNLIGGEQIRPNRIAIGIFLMIMDNPINVNDSDGFEMLRLMYLDLRKEFV